MNTKEHILNTAEGLFNVHGYTAIGVDLIRDEAQVSKTSIYRHFGSKAKLIEAVLIRRHQRFEEALSKAVANASDVESKLDALVKWHFQWFQQEHFHGCMFMHAIAEYKNSDIDITHIAIQHKQWINSLLTTILAESNPQSQEKVRHKVEAIMTFIEGMIIRAEFEKIMEPESIYQTSVRRLAGF